MASRFDNELDRVRALLRITGATNRLTGALKEYHQVTQGGTGPGRLTPEQIRNSQAMSLRIRRERPD